MEQEEEWFLMPKDLPTPTNIDWHDDRHLEVIRLKVRIMDQAIEAVKLLKEAGYTPINPQLFRTIANKMYDWSVFEPES